MKEEYKIVRVVFMGVGGLFGMMGYGLKLEKDWVGVGLVRGGLLWGVWG